MNNEILDKILHSYLWAWKLKQDKDPKYPKLNFEKIARAQEQLIEDWHLEFLKRQLINDGFLVASDSKNGEPYELTPLGIKATQNGGYKSFQAEKQTDRDIKSQTLANLKSSKYSLIISIFAIIVPTIISLYSLWTSKQSPTDEEVQHLLQRIERMENLKDETKNAPISETSHVDTLKKHKLN